MNDDKETKNDNKDIEPKKKPIDDGRTISNMNVDGLRWYTPEKNKCHRKELADLNISKEERRAMIKGALLAIFPIVFAFIGAFLAIFLIIYLWLN